MHIHIYVLVVTWLCDLNTVHRLWDKGKPPSAMLCAHFNAEKWFNSSLWKYFLKNLEKHWWLIESLFRWLFPCSFIDNQCLFRKCTLSTPFSRSRSVTINSFIFEPTGCVMCRFSHTCYIYSCNNSTHVCTRSRCGCTIDKKKALRRPCRYIFMCWLSHGCAM